MITITMIGGIRYRMEYRQGGSLMVSREGDLSYVAIQIKECMAHMRFIAQGKTVPVPSPNNKG